MRYQRRRVNGPLAVGLTLLSACTTYGPVTPTQLTPERQVRARFAEPRDVRLVLVDRPDSASVWHTAQLEGHLARTAGDTIELLVRDTTMRQSQATTPMAPASSAGASSARASDARMLRATFIADSATKVEVLHTSAARTTLLVLGIAALTAGVIVAVEAIGLSEAGYSLSVR